MTKEERSKIISEIIELQMIVLNHYKETRTAREGDEVHHIRIKLKELRNQVFGNKGRGETIVYRR